MGFIIHFYIIFGTNLLTQGPVQIVVFCLFQCFAEKEYQTESKRNETFGRVIFGTVSIQKTWSTREGTREVATRVQGVPPHPRGPPLAPPMPSFLLYISSYPENIEATDETLIPPPQHSVPVRSHVGACSGASSEGGSITECFYINTIASPMSCE